MRERTETGGENRLKWGSGHVAILLCAGSIDHRDLPIGTNISSASIPVSGKPVICWILDDLLERGCRDFVVVISSADLRLKSSIERAHSRRARLSVVVVDAGGSINDSLLAGVVAAGKIEGVRHLSVVFGDTLIRDELVFHRDFVCVKKVEDAGRWCLVKLSQEERVLGFTDKPDGPVCGEHWAAAGYFFFRNVELLKVAANHAVDNGLLDFSATLTAYMGHTCIWALSVEDWLDFGHADRLAEARRALLQPRYFNELTVDPVLNTITKVSEHSEKLRNEIDWYFEIPDELKVLTPRIVSRSEKGGKVKVVQEYYGYPTLAELYVHGDLHIERWQSILQHLVRIHQCFRRYSARIDRSAVSSMYWDKTVGRLQDLERQSATWREFFGYDRILLNGRSLRGIGTLMKPLRVLVEGLLENPENGVVHGDFCFSNILFDMNAQIVRLIDPRGSFGVKGVYGDTRYDMAKLRHSISGFYDYITSDMFEINRDGHVVTGELFDTARLIPLTEYFDFVVESIGYSPRDIKLIEALLFLSMPPLHQDFPKRQLMMFMRGLELVNEILECE